MRLEYVVYDEHPRLHRPPEQRVVMRTTRRGEAVEAAERLTYGRAYAFDGAGNCVGMLVRAGRRVEIWPLPAGFEPGAPWRALV